MGLRPEAEGCKIPVWGPVGSTWAVHGQLRREELCHEEVNCTWREGLLTLARSYRRFVGNPTVKNSATRK